MNPKKVKKEIEYKLGLYFGIKSGVIGIKDGTAYGTIEEVQANLQRDIIQDVNYLAIKYRQGKPEHQDFKSICIYYRNHLMNL